MQTLATPALVPYTSTLNPSSVSRVLIRWTPDGPMRAGHDYIPVDAELPGFASAADVGKAIVALRNAAREHHAPIRIDVFAELRAAQVDSVTEAARALVSGTPAVSVNVAAANVPAVPTRPAVSRDWAVETIDQAGAERAARDEALARELGLVLPPPVFALGTTLVQSGVDAAREERRAFEALPQADLAMRDLAATVRAEDRRDLAVMLSELKLNTNGKLCGETESGKFVVGAERDAMAKVCSLVRAELDAPGDLGVVTGLSFKDSPAIVRQSAALFNGYTAEVKVREERSSERKTVVLRTRRVGDRPQAFAVVSESYGEVDVHRVADAIGRLPDLELCRAEVVYDGRRASIDVITQTTVAPEDQTVGDMHRLVLRVRTNDTGGGSLRVDTVAERIRCRNRTLVSAEGAGIIIRHLGETATLVKKLREGLSAAYKAVRVFARQWEGAVRPLDLAAVEAAERKERAAFAEMVRRFEQEENEAAGRALMDGVYRSLLRHQDLVPARVVETTLPALKAAHYDPRNAMPGRDAVRGGLSRASLANGLTLWAQRLPVDAAHAVETVAGRVVSGDLPLTWAAAPAA